MPEVIYGTYFDSGYLSRGLTLIESMRRHGEDSQIHVLALDDAAYTYLDKAGLSNVIVHALHELEEFEPRLLETKKMRTRAEYIFTCTPWLIRFLQENFASHDALTVYLDADLYFFDRPRLVTQSMDGASVGIIEHRYNNRLATKLAKYGRFNVGWVGFRNDPDGRNVLDWYGERTLEWCADSPEDGKYADQGYLDWFPEFPGVRVLESNGFNLAPWNITKESVVIMNAPAPTHSPIRIDEDPLVFFHFHGLKRLRHRYVTGELAYSTRLSRLAKKWVYLPYINSLESAEKNVRIELPILGLHAPRGGTGWTGFMSKLRKQTLNVLSILIGNSVRIPR